MRERNKTNSVPIDHWLCCLLALRLRQIERTFPDYASFAEKSGMSRGTLQQLRYARGNPTFKTLTALSQAFGVSIWSLLAIREDIVRDEVESFGLPYDRVVELLEEDIAAGRYRDEETANIIPPVPPSKPRGRASAQRTARQRR